MTEKLFILGHETYNINNIYIHINEPARTHTHVCAHTHSKSLEESKTSFTQHTKVHTKVFVSE